MSENPESLIQKAEKCVTKSLLQWTPDYDGAIEYLKKASSIYFVNQDYIKAAETYKKTSQFYKTTGSYYYAANQLKEAANCYRLLGKLDLMFVHYLEAADILFKHGSHDSGINTYIMAAENIIETNPTKAGDALHSAASLMLVVDRQIESSKTFRRAAEAYLLGKNYKKTSLELQQSIKAALSRNPDNDIISMVHRDVIKLVIIELLHSDTVAATQHVKRATTSWGFGASEHYQNVLKLIQSIENEDGTDARVAIETSAFKNHEYEFQILVKQIPLPKVKDSAQAENNEPIKDASSNSNLISNNDDDCDDIC